MDRLRHQEIAISMDGRTLDNVFIERLWRSVKYEEVHLNSYESVRELEGRLDCYFRFYNEGATSSIAPVTRSRRRCTEKRTRFKSEFQKLPLGEIRQQVFGLLNKPLFGQKTRGHLIKNLPRSGF